MKKTIPILLAVLVLGSAVFLSGLFEQAVSGHLSVAQFAAYLSGQRYRDIYKEQDRSQLIKFSHKFHMADVGAECAQCHTGIEQSTRSSESFLSKMDNCYQCHDQKTTECSYCHIEKAEPYTAFVAPKRELVFSHAQHLADGAKCETCHADIVNKEHSVPGALPAMATCNSCHDGAKASSECAVCHTDVRFILPKDHSADWMRTHHLTVASQGDANCIMCHSQSSCQECHEGGMLEKFSKQNDFRTARAPSGVSDQRLLGIQTIHSLDYIFTHRFDAKAKTRSCQTCHESQEFCIQCHSSDKAATPAWHRVGGFATANTGGIHATLAKKDIENCTSCHNLTERNPGCEASGCHSF